jgi:hypothetical protein
MLNGHFFAVSRPTVFPAIPDGLFYFVIPLAFSLPGHSRPKHLIGSPYDVIVAAMFVVENIRDVRAGES